MPTAAAAAAVCQMVFQVSSLEQKTNLLAAYVTAGLSSSLPDIINKLGIKPRDSFEIAYNRACGMADTREFEAAETAVKAAYKQGKWKQCTASCAVPVDAHSMA
jgi:hypothetical protein